MAALATPLYHEIMSFTSASDRGKGLLVYLWLIVPNANGVPDQLDDPFRRQVYNQFLAICTDTNIPAQFNSIRANHGWPWNPQSTLDTENGKAWAKAFAYAAITIGLGVNTNDAGDGVSEQEICEAVATQVRMNVYGVWPQLLDTILQDGLALRKAELSHAEAALKAGPQVWVPPSMNVYYDNLRPPPELVKKTLAKAWADRMRKEKEAPEEERKTTGDSSAGAPEGESAGEMPQNAD